MKKLNKQFNLRSNLKKYFNYDHFREGQEEIIIDVLHGEDVLGVLKTGSGKSICYQLPAKILPGLTIVVSPLISLMIDQVRQTKAFHFKEVVALHSMQNKSERKNVLQTLHLYKLLYISPELLQQREIIQRLKEREISLFVIDEAHCISEWGYDFRPDYLRIKSIIHTLGNPPILALTGTATREVQQDIIKELGRTEMNKHIYPIDRDNISLVVEEIDGNEMNKQAFLINILEKYKVPTIIYFSSRRKAEEIALLLSHQLTNRKISYYHGGMETMDRLKVQQQFMNDQLDIICCTSAFGMGINKKNIRLVIHYHLPTQIESFIQEIGRAGRDGKESVSLVLYQKRDIQLPLQIIENELPNHDEINFAMNQLYQLFIHQNEIPTNDNEIETFFQMKRTKWRFLHYQFETRGMIIHNKINFNLDDWNKSRKEITEFCQKRLQIKRKKVYEMIQWVNKEDCLRQHLYASFEQTMQQKDEQCCSNCHFSFQQWLTEAQTEKEKIHHHSWQEKLASLLLIGEHTNETIRTH